MNVLNVTENDRAAACYRVKLPVFEGPFDLLFHLVNKEKINIWDIPIAKITEEYLLYLRSMQELKIELAGEFLVMAASLLYLKSKLLLPHPLSYLPEEEEEALYFGSKEELVRKLLEYKRFKSIAGKLKEREELQKRIFLRSPGFQRVVIVNRQCSLYPVDLEILKDAYRQLKEKNIKQTRPISLPDEVTFAHKMQEIVFLIANKGFLKYRLDDFLEGNRKEEIVLTLIVLLELAKRGKVSLYQDKDFGEITVLSL